MGMSTGQTRFLLSIAFLCLASPVVGAQDDTIRVQNLDLGWPEKARSVNPGSWMIVEGLALDGVHSQSSLIMERFEVFSPQARIVVRDGEQEELIGPPDNAYFRGHLEGQPNSIVLLSVFPDNGMRGLIAKDGGIWILASGQRARGPVVGLASRRIDIESELDPLAQGWSCAAGDLSGPQGLVEALTQPVLDRGFAAPSGPEATSYTARIAIETDWEFFNDAGGNTTDVLDYIGDLIAYGSTIYSAEVDTSWLIEAVNLYSSPSDPWQQSSPSCGLYEFGRYWNDNYSNVDRTIAHFMSGKNNGGGVAWLGVLCRSGFDVNLGSSCSGLSPRTDNYGGDYGYSGSMNGNFNIDNPTVVWDLVVVTHEIGHNFNSPHTHDYCGIGGNPNPVDTCVPAQYGPACNGESGSLPPGCSAGQGCGTIMSYCHLISGGMGNIAPTLGLGHPWGDEPGRVPARMLSHVQSRANQYPTCLAPVIPSLIFQGNFETGNTTAWSETAQ